MRPIRNLLCILAFLALPAFGGVFGNLRGVVHDPHHRPVAGARAILHSTTSQLEISMQTGEDGSFEFDAVPMGEYRVAVEQPGFETQVQNVFVASGSAPVVHYQLAIASAKQTVEVSGTAATASPESPTTQTVVRRSEIAHTPGVDSANSLSLITNFVPGAYMVHDQLHLRGGHQITWAIDGVPLPNTNIASNVGPQFDPKDIDYVEIQRGGESAEYGDRTYGVINVATRSGFERSREAELVASYGSNNATDNQFSFGDHSKKFAYYFSLNGNRSDYGLEPPTDRNLHNQNAGTGMFTSLIYNLSERDQLRFTGGARNDFYQVPNDPDQHADGIRDRQREQDAFGTLSWVHTFNPGTLLTISPFYHFNRAAFEGGPQDVPIATDNRSSQYLGGQASLSVIRGKHNARVGLYAFAQRDNTLLGLIANDGTDASFRQRSIAKGDLQAVFVEDQYHATNWMTLNAGVRLTRFSGGLGETSADPRLGASIQIPKLKWILHGSYSRYYQAPPLQSPSGSIAELLSSRDLGFLPLRGERDEQHEIGLTIPVHGWTAELTYFRTGARNFFDHDVIGNSNIFFPLTIDHARIRGTEVAVRSPRLFGNTSVHLAYSNQMTQGYGAISGGLTDFSPPEVGGFYLDHDQRNTLSSGFESELGWHTWVASSFTYGSGFLNGDGPSHLPAYQTVNVSVGKSFGEKWSAKVSALNVTNERHQIDFSNTFGGSHFSEPRTVSLQLNYKFHY